MAVPRTDGFADRCIPSHQFRRRLKYFRHEPFAPFALALEVRLVNGGGGFELGKFGFQRLDAGRGRPSSPNTCASRR
jgi:hypothetical protein